MGDRPVFAFVLMPFAKEFDDLYTFGIKEAASEVGVVAERLDEQIFVEGMMERIYRQIEAADIIVAEMSGQNANVFYEVGYAHAKEKICILQTKESKDIPFDLKHRRHIVHGGSIATCKKELIENLEWAKTEVENVRKSQIRVDFKQPNANLETTSLTATASLDFKVDLFNDSNTSSSEIKAVYFYSGLPWNIDQGGHSCPYTSSDIPKYKYRHFLDPPISMLPPRSWAQLKFNAKRMVASKIDGDEIRDSYLIAGHATLRFVTNTGTFDYELPIHTETWNFPF